MAIADRSGLVVPIVLWGRKCPKNRICHVSCLQNGRVIITGTAEGQIIQWIVDETLGWIQPQMMMLAHESPITCISPASLSSTSTKYVTCSQDGHVCLWDSVDGRVVESVRGNYTHRRIVPHALLTSQQSTSHATTYLFCIGDYAEIAVMDSQDLNILFNLSSRVEPDWMSTITIVQPQDKHDVVIGVSVSGMIKLWSLDDLDKKDAGYVIYEDESKTMTSKNVHFIHCSNFNTRMMLVLCTNSWQIMDPSNLNQIIVLECSIEPVQGTIIDIDRVAIGFADSTIVLFQLPRSKLVGKQIRDRFGENPLNIGNIDQPFPFALVKGISVSPNTPLWSNVQFYFETQKNAEGKIRKVAYRVDRQGSLSVWHIPKNYDLLVNESIRSRRPVVYEPTIKQNFDEVWNRLNPSPPTILNAEDDSILITSTIFVTSQCKLFVGRVDGSIAVMNACHAIMMQLLETSTLDNIQQRLLYGHSASVNCFLYPFEENPRYDPQYLLSGGADFAVVVWNIGTGAKLHKFCCQGGPILRMLVPPSNSSTRVLNTICAIAGDNSAALLSLKENKCILLASRQQFPIIDVRWRPLDDFMLLRCEDDSVYVWEIETANLDRIVTGLVTEDIMEACKEQIGLADVEDEAGASQAIQMLRALKNKNVAAIRKIAAPNEDSNKNNLETSNVPTILPSMDIVQLKKCSDQTLLLLFNVDNIIAGLLSMDYELSALLPPHSNDINQSLNSSILETKMSLSTLITKKAEQHLQNQNHLPNSMSPTGTNTLLGPKPVGGSLKSFATAHNEPASSLYMDTARLLVSLLHAWNLDEHVDSICLKNLKLLKPKVSICYGSISRKGHISLYMPYCTGKLPALNDLSYLNFSKNIRWQENKMLTTLHLLTIVSLSNTLMSFRSRSLHLTGGAVKRPTLRRVSSTKSTDSTAALESESQQIKQGWSSIAALHCVLLSDLVKPSNISSLPYASPRIDLLARRWQDNCIEIRDAAQALLIRELERLGSEGRRKLIDSWALFLPTLLDPSLSIFGNKLSSSQFNSNMSSTFVTSAQQSQASTPVAQQFIVSGTSTNAVAIVTSIESSTVVGAPSSKPPPIPPPPIRAPAVPPRSSTSANLPQPQTTPNNQLGNLDSIDSTSKQLNRNSLILNGGESSESSIGAVSSSTISAIGITTNSTPDQQSTNNSSSLWIIDKSDDKCGGIHQVRRNQATSIIVLSVIGAEFPLDLQSNADLVRATAHSLLELLLAPESPLLPLYSPLRRAAIDLLGRGFAVWQPHLDISKVLLGLLDLAAGDDKTLPSNSGDHHFGVPLSPSADACKTARHSLSLIASTRPHALITALSMEVVRYNSAAQHQTIQHAVTSPLMKSRAEILRLIEQLSDKHYNCVSDLIIPVGDILVHCLDMSQLKQRTLAEIYPPIAKFYMVAYCGATRRIAFGGKNGVIIVHELRASKAQTVSAHKAPITALAFSQEGKYLAAYAAQDAKISFWQTQQTFLGMGQSQIRCIKTLPAPSEFPVISPGGSYQLFRARLVWINSKSLTLMLPNGKENRFSV